MRIVLQRVTHASVTVGNSITGEIGMGLLVLAGFAATDSEPLLRRMARKFLDLRIFPDGEERMNRSVLEAGGGVLVVSQFTLFADCRKGRRPSFASAAPPDQARRLYELFLEILRELGVPPQTGSFGAKMSVELLNDGPVTIILDSDALFASPPAPPTSEPASQ